MLEDDDPNKASFLKAGESIRLFSDDDNMKKFVLVRTPNAETKQAAATQLSSNMAAAVHTVEHQQGWSAGETAHCLFGHLEANTITTTQKFLGMPVTNHLSGGTAHNCPICKMQKTKTKLNLVPSDTVASMQYSRMTMDVHPLASPIPTVGGMVSAILHIVDVYSARGFLYDLLAGKSDHWQMVPILKKFISDVKVQNSNYRNCLVLIAVNDWNTSLD